MQRASRRGWALHAKIATHRGVAPRNGVRSRQAVDACGRFAGRAVAPGVQRPALTSTVVCAAPLPRASGDLKSPGNCPRPLAGRSANADLSPLVPHACAPWRPVGVRSRWHAPAFAADEPDLIFKRSTVFKWLTPNDKLATYGLDDPEVEGVACHFTVPERGGLKGWIGVAEEVSDISLACRQIGPIHFKQKFSQGEDMFRQRRSLFFKKMQIVRGCDVKRNVLVYMVYSDKIIEGSPKNSTSSVPIMPWGAERRGAEVRGLDRRLVSVSDVRIIRIICSADLPIPGSPDCGHLERFEEILHTGLAVRIRASRNDCG